MSKQRRKQDTISERLDMYVGEPGGSTIVFYTFGPYIELNGQLLKAGELTADLLNMPTDFLRESARTILELHQQYQKSRDKECWEKMNEEMESLCARLREYTVFKHLLTENEDRIFAETKLLFKKYWDLPRKQYKLTEQDLELSFRRSDMIEAGLPEKDIPDLPPSMLVHTGSKEQKWRFYQLQVDRYIMYCLDIMAFAPTIHNFINFVLSGLETNNPENYAAALYDFYNDQRLVHKLIVNPTSYSPVGYWTHDTFRLAYTPRQTPDGKMTICQEHITGSFQALMKSDYMQALNSGYNIRRCKICGKYFLLTTGAHALYCEGECPHAPGFTCRQFGTSQVQKELARDIPKVRVKQRAFERVTKDAKRGAITKDEERAAKDYIRDKLYDALRDSHISVEDFEKAVSSEHVYDLCQINRISKPRGRPRTVESGEAL